MTLDTFAGPVFSTQDVVVIYSIMFVIASLLVGLVVYGLKAAYDRLIVRSKRANLSLTKAVAIGCCIVAVATLAFNVVPQMMRDKRWEQKQLACARENGYVHPTSDASLTTTAIEAQIAYSRCLDR